MKSISRAQHFSSHFMFRIAIQKLFYNNDNNKNNSNLPWAYHPLGQAAVIIRIHMQSVSTVFFFLHTAVSAFLPSNVLTDDTLARLE